MKLNKLLYNILDKELIGTKISNNDEIYTISNFILTNNGILIMTKENIDFILDGKQDFKVIN